MESNVKTLILASLFHDIGKFMQRAGESLDERYGKIPDPGEHGAHARWSAMYAARFLHDPVIEDLVLYHHSPQSSKNPDLAAIVQKADHLSSAIDRRERVSGDKGQILKEPLKAVFPQICLNGKGGSRQNDYVYPLHPLGAGESAFPVRQSEMGLWNLSDAYRDLWRKFEQESEQLPGDPPVLTVMSLLRKYTSLIPSAVFVNEPDIPLYDHAKTTAALAHCFLEGESEKPFLLVGGDLSGIQKFIFSTVIPEQARKGTAKRLRGRSFWLSLLTDALAREIVRECGLSECSVLWNTGGNFLVLAPNTRKNRDRVGFIGRKVNENLLRKWNGRLSVTLATLEAGEEEMKNFSSVRERLSVISTGKKRQKFIDCGLTFEPDGSEEPISSFCSVCGTHKSEKTECSECSMFHEIGTKLVHAKFLTAGQNLPFSFADLGLQAGYDLVSDLPLEHPGEIFTLNSSDIRIKHRGGAGFLFVGNTVPVAGHEILTFSEMAQLSKGSPRLGYLKADVDNLGMIFGAGLAKDLRTISRVHTLSSQLQYFFSGYINSICNRFVVYRDLCTACMPAAEKITVRIPPEEGREGRETVYYVHPNPCPACRDRYSVPKFYITYSGGDDLFIIGPWDDTIRLADELNREFQRFTCSNPDITLSAGIAIVHPNLPVARAVIQAGALLEDAKGMPGKAHVAVFDTTVPLREGTGEQNLSALIRIAAGMMEFVEQKVIPKNMIYTFLNLWEQSFRPPRKEIGAKRSPSGDTPAGEKKRTGAEREQDLLRTSKRHLPYLKYTLKRNIRNDEHRRDVEELVVPAFPWIRLPVYMTSLALRKDRGD